VARVYCGVACCVACGVSWCGCAWPGVRWGLSSCFPRCLAMEPPFGQALEPGTLRHLYAALPGDRAGAGGRGAPEGLKAPVPLHGGMSPLGPDVHSDVFWAMRDAGWNGGRSSASWSTDSKEEPGDPEPGAAEVAGEGSASGAGPGPGSVPVASSAAPSSLPVLQRGTSGSSVPGAGGASGGGGGGGASGGGGGGGGSVLVGVKAHDVTMLRASVLQQTRNHMKAPQ
jgi:hypothetical protein